MKFSASILLALFPALAFADVTVQCANPSGSLRYTFQQSTPGTIPTGGKPSRPEIKVLVNGAELPDSNPEMTDEQVLENTARGNGAEIQTIYSAKLAFTAAGERGSEYVICEKNSTLNP